MNFLKNEINSSNVVECFNAVTGRHWTTLESNANSKAPRP